MARDTVEQLLEREELLPFCISMLVLDLHLESDGISRPQIQYVDHSRADLQEYRCYS